jgi:hypothetical protein
MNLIRLAEAGDTAGVLRELGALTPRADLNGSWRDGLCFPACDEREHTGCVGVRLDGVDHQPLVGLVHGADDFDVEGQLPRLRGVDPFSY